MTSRIGTMGNASPIVSAYWDSAEARARSSCCVASDMFDLSQRCARSANMQMRSMIPKVLIKSYRKHLCLKSSHFCLSWPPLTIFRDKRVCEDDELAHNGGQSDFRVLSLLHEIPVEITQKPAALCHADSTHIKHVAHMHTSTAYHAGTASRATVAAHWCEPCEGSNFLAV